MKPNFLIIGASKCGTTSLWDLLGQHPEVFVCQPKEPNFFGNDDNYARGWSWYQSLFADAGAAKAIGEFSAAYSATVRFPQVPERIAKHLPDVRLIYVVRHPLERIESAYVQCLHTGHPMPRSFPEAVRQYPPLIADSLYWRCVSDYRRHFPDDQIKVLFFEDFKADPDRFLAGLCRILDVDDSFRFPDADRPRNPSAEHDMDSSFYLMLRRIPGMRLIGKAFPRRLKTHVRKWFRVPVPGRPEWDSGTLLWVLDRVAAEAKAILEYAGKPRDFWALGAK